MNDERRGSAGGSAGAAIVSDDNAASFQTPSAIGADPAPLTHREKRLIVISMMLPVFLGSVDQSILASALPTIGRSLGEVHNLPWLITAFLIASTALTPLYGKFADIHGRRAAMLIGLVRLYGRLAGLRAVAEHADADLRPRHSGLRRRRADRDRQYDPRRHRRAQGSRQVLQPISRSRSPRRAAPGRRSAAGFPIICIGR